MRALRFAPVVFLVLASCYDPEISSAEQAETTSEDNKFVTWFYNDEVHEFDLIIPTPFDNIKQQIPESHWDKVIQPAPGLALLLFNLKKADQTTVIPMPEGGTTYSQPQAIELAIGVLYFSGNPDDGELQFYTLQRITNFSKLSSSQKEMGLPSALVKEIGFNIVFNPLTQTGVASISVPWDVSPFQADIQFSTASEVEISGQAGEFHQGIHGLVRVTHSGSFSMNSASGTVTAAPGSLISQWMGAPTRDGAGDLYLDFNPLNHVLVAEIVEPN
jgi:hypothetical protein